MRVWFAAWAVVLCLGLVVPTQAAEPAGGGDPAPHELPASVVKVLRTTNKAQIHRYVPKVYDVQNTNPYSLLRWVRRSAEIEEGGFYFFGKPNESGVVNSGKVLVLLPEYMLPGMDRLMATIDRANLTSSSGEVFFYYRPKHRNVTDAGFTGVIRDVLRGTSGDFASDTAANCFVVYAAPSKINDVKEGLAFVDTPPKQVIIEVTIYEIQVDNQSKIGLDYVAWKNGPGRNLFAFGAYSERAKITHRDIDALPRGPGPGGRPEPSCPLLQAIGNLYGLPGHGFSSRGSNCAYLFDVASAFFDFLVVKGKARVMTSAKIAARNLIPAEVKAGDTILYYRTQVGPAQLAGMRPYGLPLDPFGTSPTYPDNRTVVGATISRVLAGATTGVLLRITPTIGTSQIQLVVETEVVSHTGFDDKGTPMLVRRRVVTELACQDSQELVLGGFTREVFVQRADKVPVLGSLPLIGYLFGGDANTTEQRRVVIALTPRVINDFSGMDYAPTQISGDGIKARALQQEPKAVPRTEFGFDQWLLDKEAKQP